MARNYTNNITGNPVNFENEWQKQKIKNAESVLYDKTTVSELSESLLDNQEKIHSRLVDIIHQTLRSPEFLKLVRDEILGVTKGAVERIMADGEIASLMEAKLRQQIQTMFNEQVDKRARELMDQYIANLAKKLGPG